jgi:hypothetical protein
MATTAIEKAKQMAQTGISKTEALEKLARLRTYMANNRVKEKAHHAAKTGIGGALAAVGGAGAGLLAVKLPFVPKTKVRSDLALGTLGLLAAAAGEMFLGVEVSNSVADVSKGLIGSGVSRHTEDLLISKGVTRG